MRSVTSGNIIVPSVQGWLQLQANTKQGYIDVLCFYSPHFTSTLLSDQDVLRSTKFAKEYQDQTMVKYFDLNDDKINGDLASKGCVDILHPGYQMDYGSCTLTCIHHNHKRMNIEIPEIVCGGLCFILPLILPDLPKDHLKATLLNSPQLAYKYDPKFKKRI